MSFKRNLAASYASQLYVVAVGIVMVPLYIKYLGAEAYGLVGFWMMLQAWFLLLDLGLGSAVSRETARFNGGATSAVGYRGVLTFVEVFLSALALLVGCLLLLVSDDVARTWLTADSLEATEIASCIRMMVGIVVCRLLSGLYRGVVAGFERQAALAAYNATFATLRFVLVIPILIYAEASATYFFLYQLAISVVELTGIALFAYVLLPPISLFRPGGWPHLQAVKPVLKLSMTIGFTSTVWVVVTQTDKLILSGILDLEEYGRFTLAVLVASGIMIISTPMSLTLMPRMTRLAAENDSQGLLKLYRKCTQFVAVIGGAASATLAFQAETVLLAWTGDREIASQAAPILALYATGNGALILCTFPYYMQYARGRLGLHLIGNCVFVVVLLPAIVFAASRYGGQGAGYVWLGTNVLCLLFWVPFVHGRLQPGLSRVWLGRDVFSIVLPVFAAAYLFWCFVPQPDGRLLQGTALLVSGVFAMAAGALASSEFRQVLRLRWIAAVSRVRRRA